jgi:predicted DNA-binding transcriptional regulator AlpA
MKKSYTATEVAEMLGVTTKHLASLRKKDEGPPYIRVGEAVRYPDDAFNEWLAQKMRGETQESEE